MKSNESVEIARCGVCCEQCRMQKRIPRMATEMNRFVDAYGYSQWIRNVTSDFDFDNFLVGLKWFASSGCAGCSRGGGMPKCEVRDCCSQKKLQDCYRCPQFTSCNKNLYQKQTYRIGDQYARIAQTGYSKWLQEQRRKTRNGFDNIEYLGGTKGMIID